MRNVRIAALAAALVLALAAPALATNGYFSLGYGTPYKGMAGAGQALHLNTLASATNPATIAFVKGYDISLALFNPNREYTVTGNPSGYPGTFGLAPGNYESDSRPSSCRAWPAPGTSPRTAPPRPRHLRQRRHEHRLPEPGLRPGARRRQPDAGLRRALLHVGVRDHQAIGVSPIFGWQSFEAKGLGAFSMFSSTPRS